MCLKQPAQRAGIILLLLGLFSWTVVLIWFAYFLYRPALRTSGFIDQFGDFIWNGEKTLIHALFKTGFYETGAGIALLFLYESCIKPIIEWIRHGNGKK